MRLPWSLGDSPWPSTLTVFLARSLATSGATTTRAPPPSLTTQQSSRCSGSLIIGESSTSSTVTGLRSIAFGLYRACWLAATLTAASCALVVPYSCMCRRAASAYIEGVVGPKGDSKALSGPLGLPDRAGGCDLGSPASVISATRHLPAAIAAAAWPT